MGWLVLLSLAITLVVCFFLKLNFALGAIVGLLHDVSITLGLLSIMGVEIDLNVMVSLGTAALRTTIVFDRKRERLLEEARQQREQAQQTRLERIRQQRRLEADRAQKRKDAEQSGKK